jgi:large subunit ribosomal protein L15
MNLSELPQTSIPRKKRRGQGYGSGKGGHTSGRGQKGQRTRGSIPLWFEGGQLPQIRRFPFIRGKSRFKPLGDGVIEINLGKLNQLAKDSTVDHQALLKAGIIKPAELKQKTIKILGRGELTIPLIVNLPVSAGAAKKIIAAGGKINRESTL